MADLPVVGKVPKGWLIAVGGGSIVVVGYVWWRHKTAASSATTSTTAPAAATGTSGDPYPADGTTGNPGDPNSTDPETGMTYGDEQLYGAGGYGTGGYGGYGPYGTGGGTGGGTTGQGPGSFTSNADWATYAEQQLAGTVDPTALSAALGVYLTGRPASSDQVSLIDQAIAIAGYPPVAGPGNNPPGIVQGGGGGGGQGTVPNVVGQNHSFAVKAIAAAGLNPVTARGRWKDPVKSVSPPAGTQLSQGASVTITGSG